MFVTKSDPYAAGVGASAKHTAFDALLEQGHPRFATAGWWSIYTIGALTDRLDPVHALVGDNADNSLHRLFRIEVPMAQQMPRFGRVVRASALAALLGLTTSNVAASSASGPVATIEFYNAALDHYFLTINPQEISDLDLGVHGGWTRTGQTFPVFGSAESAAVTSANPVCRFYIPPQHGDSHFFSADSVECNLILAKMQNDPNFSGYVQETPSAFYVGLPDPATGACPATTSPVYRLWNGRADSNHRYAASLAIKNLMIAMGYVAEGHGPDAVAMCAPESTKTSRVVVVPLRYQAAPSASPEAMAAYNSTIAQVTQAGAQAAFAQIAPWWNAETYGKHSLDVTVLPAAELPGNPGCDYARIYTDAHNAAAADFDILIAITPYACWQSHAITVGNLVISWNTYTNEPGTLAHEIGHAFGLSHNAAQLPPANTFVPYGSSVDQMGRVAAGLAHFLSDHKNLLGALTPLPCGSATLRSIYATPDAIRCGDYFVDYLPDWGVDGEVWIHKREYHFGAYSSDTTDVAHLAPGTSFNADGYTFTHIGGGKVNVTQ